MNDETKKQINEKYQRELQHGERFWPDSIFKDLIVSLGIFVLLVLMASFLGVENAPKADPSDTSYIPRPEWYFLFLFKFLALYGQIPVLGKIEWLATVLVPGIGIGLLTLLPFIDRSPQRYYTRRMLPITVMGLIVLDMVLLTTMSDIPTVSESGSRLSGTLQTIAGLAIPGLAILLLIGMAFAVERPKLAAFAFLLVAAAFAANTALGVYHVGVEWKLWPGPDTCAAAQSLPTSATDLLAAAENAVVVRCDEAALYIFGLSLAGWNVVASLAIAALALRAAYLAAFES